MTPKIKFFPITDATIKQKLKQTNEDGKEDFFLFTNLVPSDLGVNGNPIWWDILHIDSQTSYKSLEKEYLGVFTDTNNVSGRLYRYRFFKNLQQQGASAANVLTNLGILMPAGSFVYWVYGDASSLVVFEVLSDGIRQGQIINDVSEPTLGAFLDFSKCPIDTIDMQNCMLTSGTIDAILIQAAASAEISGNIEGIVNLGGNNDARTSASDDAVAALQAVDWVLTLN